MDNKAFDRFCAKFTMDDDCWIWNATTSGGGYGQFKLDGKMLKAHRVSFEEFVGPIPKDLELDHRCSIPACVRPGHLEPVTHAENVKRGRAGALNRMKSSCPQGHPLSGENLYRSGGRRICRECNRQAMARYRASKKVD